MAKIPVGNFGYRVAETSPGNRVGPRAFVDGDPGGLDKITQAALGEVRRQRREEDVARRQAEAELARARAIEAHTGFQNDALELADSLEKRLKAKEIKREEIPELWTQGVDELRARRLEGVAPEDQPTVGASFGQVEGRLRQGLRKVIDTDIREERVAKVNGSLEELHRLALVDPQGAIQQANQIIDAQADIIGADKLQEEKQRFQERALYSHVTKLVNDNRGSRAGLERVLNDLNGEKYAGLDPDKRNTLANHAQIQIDRLDARAEAAAARREAQLERGIREVEKVAMAGFPVSPESLDALERGAKGTALEGQVAALKAQVNYVGKFAAAPPTVMEAELQRLDADMRKPGARVTPELIEKRNALGRLYETTKRQIQENPIGYAGARGLADVQPLDLSDPDSLKSQLQARVEVAYGLNKTLGAPVKVLMPEEAEALGTMLRDSTPEQKQQLLGVLERAVGDQAAYAGVMGQIAPDSPVTAYAGVLMAKQRDVTIKKWGTDETVSPRQTSRYLLQGEALLNPPKGAKGADGKSRGFPMPTETMLRPDFDGQAGEAFRGAPQAADVAYQAAKAIYAGMAAEAGDYSGEIDGSRWKKAITMATGGIGSFNGAKVVLPYGMEEGAFRDAVRGQLDAAVRDKRVSASKEQIRGMQIESVGDARYLVRSGGSYLLDNTGAPLVLDLTEPRRFMSGGQPVSEQIPK